MTRRKILPEQPHCKAANMSKMYMVWNLQTLPKKGAFKQHQWLKTCHCLPHYQLSWQSQICLWYVTQDLSFQIIYFTSSEKNCPKRAKQFVWELHLEKLAFEGDKNHFSFVQVLDHLGGKWKYFPTLPHGIIQHFQDLVKILWGVFQLDIQWQYASGDSHVTQIASHVT